MTEGGHRCHRQHRRYSTLARCRWPRVEWVSGEGSWAVLAECGVLTVSLHESVENAVGSKKFIDEFGCGHACVREHLIVELGDLNDDTGGRT